MADVVVLRLILYIAAGLVLGSTPMILGLTCSADQILKGIR